RGPVAARLRPGAGAPLLAPVDVRGGQAGLLQRRCTEVAISVHLERVGDARPHCICPGEKALQGHIAAATVDVSKTAQPVAGHAATEQGGYGTAVERP